MQDICYLAGPGGGAGEALNATLSLELTLPGRGTAQAWWK